jgi:hypothetical protein
MKLRSSLDGLCIRCLVFRLFTSRGGEKLQSQDARWRWARVFVNSWVVIGSSMSLIYDITVFGVGAGTSEEETSCVFQVSYTVFLCCVRFCGTVIILYVSEFYSTDKRVHKRLKPRRQCSEISTLENCKTLEIVSRPSTSSTHWSYKLRTQYTIPNISSHFLRSNTISLTTAQ